jgi:hypothetical protein
MFGENVPPKIAEEARRITQEVVVPIYYFSHK